MSIREEIHALQPEKKDFRSFGLVVGGVFLAIAAFALWREKAWYVWPAGIGAPLVVLGAVVPSILRPVYFAWMSMAVVLGFVMTRVILTLFFFLVLTPVGLFFKLIGRDALHRKIDRSGTTYWIDKKYDIEDRSRFEKFF